ncbi:MAG TPA: hypothetical protein PLE30_06470 [Candidatus Kapabacteria bacterium]|nr:hypothetical protein [Candidatus Kapabacteria bacterium]
MNVWIKKIIVYLTYMMCVFHNIIPHNHYVASLLQLSKEQSKHIENTRNLNLISLDNDTKQSAYRFENPGEKDSDNTFFAPHEDNPIKLNHKAFALFPLFLIAIIIKIVATVSIKYSYYLMEEIPKLQLLILKSIKPLRAPPLSFNLK